MIKKNKNNNNNKYMLDDLCNVYMYYILSYLFYRVVFKRFEYYNKTNHPISNNSHQSATVNEAIHSFN